MKYALIIPDGCADEAQESLGGKTPLEAACLPAMDDVAAAGVVGRANHVPELLPPGSDVANLSLLGYNPLEHFTGRAPLEAAAQGIDLGPADWAVRCNLVTIENQVMRDFTAGHIASAEAAELLKAAQQKLGNENLQFYPGVSYRNLLVYRSGGGPVPFCGDTRTTPPHDLTDQSVLDDYPRGPGSDELRRLMHQSVALLADHPVNVARREQGKLPATHVWLWGLGKTPKLRPFDELYGKRGAMITAVDLLRGLATLIGWRRIEVPGATAYTDTDYSAKGRYAVDALGEVDIVCVHVEATDEASHEGDAAAKVKALEAIDRHIVGPVHAALKSRGDYRILVSPDHPTPLRTKTHSHGFVPFAMAGTGIRPDAAETYDDPTADRSRLVFEEGWRLMRSFLGDVAVSCGSG
ncbi:MAG: cofactor-independent phosphoglycerate mutase [Planctomycetes bacterium RBG_13_63_9]|nr:MAG: cofactor-independent phosphoglycerate mutase [Planctomycetes bacterium RBG_13_63_9]